jgi:hypothetical protein
VQHEHLGARTIRIGRAVVGRAAVDAEAETGVDTQHVAEPVTDADDRRVHRSVGGRTERTDLHGVTSEVADR